MVTIADAPAAPAVLLIDDEGCIRACVSRILERAGYCVTTAASGTEGLERVRTESFAAVICDLRMPGLSGIALFDQIQRAAPSLTGRILVASGDLSQMETTIFLERTGTPSLLKPYASSDLIGALDRICAVPARPRGQESLEVASTRAAS
jgi:DNA-binding NtrC family response regulator